MTLFDRVFRVTLAVMFGLSIALSSLAWRYDLPRLKQDPNDPWWHFPVATGLALALFLAMDEVDRRRNLRLDREGGGRHGD